MNHHLPVASSSSTVLTVDGATLFAPVLDRNVGHSVTPEDGDDNDVEKWPILPSLYCTGGTTTSFFAVRVAQRGREGGGAG